MFFHRKLSIVSNPHETEENDLNYMTHSYCAAHITHDLFDCDKLLLQGDSMRRLTTPTTRAISIWCWLEPILTLCYISCRGRPLPLLACRAEDGAPFGPGFQLLNPTSFRIFAAHAAGRWFISLSCYFCILISNRKKSIFRPWIFHEVQFSS
jgi:hypothetical protein